MPVSQKHQLAIDLYRMGRLQEADKMIGAALREDESGELWNDWAVIQFALGRQTEAQEGFRRAIAIDPSSHEPSSNLTSLLCASKDRGPFSLQAFQDGHGENEGMPWCAAMEKSAGNGNGFHSPVPTQSAMAQVESPGFQKWPQASPASSESELALLDAYQKFATTLAELRQTAHELVARYPQSHESRLFLADVLQASGNADKALEEYAALRERVPVNQRRRIEQAIQQCQADRDYFPPEFAKRLETKEYAAAGITPRNANGAASCEKGKIDRDRELMAASWRNYANREIQRGREIVRIVRERIPLNGRRVLDVGCGYGGTLIAFAEAGASVVGIEIDNERFEVGAKRLRDLSIDADYRRDDICDPASANRLGTFDVIVAQDVMEHVLDPLRAMQTLSTILRVGGVIYVQVGNKYSFDQLLADHHYRLTGITLLARNQAIEYFCAATGIDASGYGVGYWRTERFYRRIFDRFGVRLEHIDPPGTPNHVMWYSNMAKEVCRRGNEEIHPRVRPELQTCIRHRMAAVTRFFARTSQFMRKFEANPNVVNALADSVVKRVCTPVWRFLGNKEIVTN